MSAPAFLGLLGAPAAAILVLALVPNYRVSAALNTLASLIAFVAACSFLFTPPLQGTLLLIDDFNIYMVVLNTFVGFTASVFSASYIGHELETGRLTPAYIRFYHAMYQAMMGR